jgi:valyl-tRNA synthetase
MQSRLNAAIAEIRDDLDAYRFNDAAVALYRFIWTEFCDWGIELSKAEEESVAEIGAIFIESLKLLSPFMPFLSERLYRELTKKSGSVTIAPFPKASRRDLDAEESFNVAIEAITAIRRAKTLVDLANKPIAKAFVRPFKSGVKLPLHFIEKLARVEKVEITNEKQKGSGDISDNLEAIVPIENLDLSPLIARLEAQKIKALKEREKLQNMLNNDNFTANAPKETLEKTEDSLRESEKKLREIDERLKALS